MVSYKRQQHYLIKIRKLKHQFRIALVRPSFYGAYGKAKAAFEGAVVKPDFRTALFGQIVR